MSKYRNTVYYDFKSRFLVIFLVITGSVENTVSRPYFSQNLKIPYWKSSFSVHRKILRPPPPPSDNLIFLISVVLSLAFLLVLKTTEVWFFQSVHLYVWAIAGHEPGTLSIQLHNSMTVHDNSWALKFDNFSEFQNVISDRPPSPASPSPSHKRHYNALRTKIDM